MTACGSQLSEAVEALTNQLADQTLRGDRQDEQVRTLAAALRATAASQARDTAALAKTVKQNGRNPGNGDRRRPPLNQTEARY
jgi:hypothetical protein